MPRTPDYANDVAEILIPEPILQAKVAELGARLSIDYEGRPVTLVSVLMLIGSWLARPIFPSGTDLNHLLWAFAAPGAAGIVLVALAWGPAIRLFETRPIQWLGKISFSLYLVHVPVLATLAFAFGSEAWGLVGLIGIPLSLLVAWGFYEAVEARMHKAARRVHRAVAARARRRAGEVAP